MHRSIVLAVFFLALATGCTQRVEQTHARWELGAPQKLKPASAGGLYCVKWSATPDEPRHAVPASKRLIGEGDLIGFAPTDGGGVLAYAGQEQFEINKLPAKARYWAWSTETVKESHLAAGFRQSARIVGAAAMLGGLLFGEALLGNVIDDLDDCPHERSPRRGDSKHQETPTPADGIERGVVPWAQPPKVP